MRSVTLLLFLFLLSQCSFYSPYRDKCRSHYYRGRQIRPLEKGRWECRRDGDFPQAVREPLEQWMASSRYHYTHLYIVCDSYRGWTGYKTWSGSMMRSIPEHTKTLECVTYCEATGDGVSITAIEEHDKKVAVACQNISFDLHYNDRQVAGNQATCSLYSGWEQNDYNSHLLSDMQSALTPKQFECRKAPTPCNYTLIDGLQFDDNKRLTCLNGNNSLKAIEYNSRLHKTLKCGRHDRSDIWKDDASGRKIAEASPSLGVTCAEYCAASGDGIKVSRVGEEIEVTCLDPNLGLLFDNSQIEKNIAKCSYYDGWKTGSKLKDKGIEKELQFQCIRPCTLHSAEAIPFDAATETFSCESRDTSTSSILKIRVDSNPSRPFESLKCDKINGWKAGHDHVAGPFVPLSATCANYCSSSGIGTVFNRTSNKIEVSCADPGFGLKFEGNSIRYRTLKCNEKDGWAATGWSGEYEIEGKKAVNRLDLTCEKYHYSCDMPTVEGYRYNMTEKKLTCKGGRLGLISFNSLETPYFICDEANGWATFSARLARLTAEPYFTPARAQCIEYCAVTGTGLTVEQTDSEREHPRVQITCANNGELFHDEEHVAGGRATCSMSDGWDASSAYYRRPSHTIPMAFECRSAPTTTSRTTAGPEPTDAPLDNAAHLPGSAQTQAGKYAAIGGSALAVAIIASIIVVCLLKKPTRPDNRVVNAVKHIDGSQYGGRRYNEEVSSAPHERELRRRRT